MEKMRTLIVFALLCLPLFGQRGTYTATRKVALSGTAEVVTIQLPADAAATSAQLIDASVYCSVACELSLELNGSTATGTAVTAVATQSGYSAATAAVYRSSTSTGGAVQSIQEVPAGQTLLLDLADIGLRRLTSPENFTIRGPTMTGTIVITLKWREY